MTEMQSWNNCIKIYDPNENTKEYPEYLSSKQHGAYLKYITKLNKISKNTIWYDKESDMCFGSDQDFFVNPDDFSFFHQKENFLTKEPWGKFHLQNMLGQHLGTNVKANSEIIIQEHPEFEKFKGKNILLVGAGPTAEEIDWENMNLDYDYIWTCNNFHKNNKLCSTQIDLALMGPTVDFKDSELLMKLKKDETFCIFEGGCSPFRSGPELTEFKNIFPDKTSYFYLRYFSKIGSMPRLLCLATILGAKKVYFVGIDGYPGKLGDKYKHTFEGDKKDHDGRIFSYDLHRRQYVLLWEYLLGLNTETEYQNLGEGHSSNLSTDITQKLFSLNIGAKNE